MISPPDFRSVGDVGSFIFRGADRIEFVRNFVGEEEAFWIDIPFKLALSNFEFLIFFFLLFHFLPPPFASVDPRWL